MAVPYAATRTASRAASRLPVPTPEEEESLLRRMGRGTLSGLAAVGNVLDLPTSSIRDVLAGQNPLDQWATPLTHENRATGRQLGEQWGLIGPNQVGKLDAGDIAGFGIEVALDPLTYLSFGTSALGKGGQAFRKAGVLDDLARKAAPHLGRREARVTQTIGDLLPHASDAQKVLLNRAAAKSGLGGLEGLAKRSGERLGGLVGVGLPFRKPSFTVGTGKVSQAVARGMDEAGKALRFGKIPGTQFSPGQQLARVFRAPAMGLHTPELGKFEGGRLFQERELINQGVRKETAEYVTKLTRQGAFDDEAGVLARMYGEGVLDRSKLTPSQLRKADAMAEVVDAYKKQFPDWIRAIRRMGGHAEEFSDPAGLEYFPRGFIEMIENNANTMHRSEYLRGWMQGTEQLRQIISDPKLAELPFEEAVRYVDNTYGEFFKTADAPTITVKPPKVTTEPLGFKQQMKPGSLAEQIAEQAKQIGGRKRTVEGGSVSMKDRMISGERREGLIRELVHHVRTKYTPEQRAFGGFGKNPLVDVANAKAGMQFKAARLGSTVESIGEFAKPLEELDEPAIRVGQLLDELNLERVVELKGRMRGGEKILEGERGGALVQIARKLGVGTDDTSLRQVENLHVPERIAEDIGRLASGDEVQKAVTGPLLKAFDSLTNMFKVGVLNWPARYVRDFTSGQAMNALTGNWSPQAFTNAHRLLAGGTADFTHIPIVQRMLAEQGLEATAENSTEILRQLAYTHEMHTAVAGPQGLSEVVGDISGMLPGRTKELAAEFPGRDPLSALRPMTFNAGDTLRSGGANPLNIRGIGGRTQTGFKPVAVGERVGRYSDSMNRLVPFIHNLERGVDPGEAAKIVNGLQVWYAPRSFTAAERRYLKRAFPFYSFSSRMLPTVMKQLMEHPGGGIAQSIRAANVARDTDSPLPEHISRGLAIPLGQTSDGSQRYLTGVDLMHEAPLDLFSVEGGLPSATGTLRSVLSQGNPYIKGPAELAFGKNLFFNRDLDELDPAGGRTFTNLGLREELPSGQARPLGSQTLEHVLANSPFSRGITSARVLTDPRKREGGPFPGSAIAANLLTGARVSDVSPAAQDAILRDIIEQRAKQLGARGFERVHFTGEGELTPEQQDLALALRLLAARAKARSQ